MIKFIAVPDVAAFAGRSVKALALFQAVSGGSVYTSETLHRLPERRLDLLEFVRPDDRIHWARVPFLDRREEIVVLHQALGNRHLIYLFNAQARDVTAAYRLDEAANINGAYLYRHESQNFTDNLEAGIVCKIPAHSGILFFADTRDPIVHAPGNLWDWEK